VWRLLLGLSSVVEGGGGSEGQADCDHEACVVSIWVLLADRGGLHIQLTHSNINSTPLPSPYCHLIAYASPSTNPAGHIRISQHIVERSL